MRLDRLLTDTGMASSRTQAQELIRSGFVTMDGKIITKPSHLLSESDAQRIAVTGKLHPYVGRGGLKLEGALCQFQVDVSEMVCADIGASTGGFTDCLLRRGAAKVFAVDSGSDQLSEILRQDSRVVSMERFNARNLTADDFGMLCDIVVADLSFISQTYVLSNICSVLRDGGIYIGLIKPQFECGPGALDKKGIVKKPEHHVMAIRRVRDAAFSVSLHMENIMLSPITGGDGNREFLCLCRKKAGDGLDFVSDSEINKLVKQL